VKPLVSLILALVTAPLFAQIPKLADEIIVTASELPETVESTPATVTVITRKQIEDQAARNVADVLRTVPGLNVSRTGSLGKITSVFVRGASSKQVLVLWNGVEINDPYFSGYNWGQFSTAGVQRIEVVRGPFSSLYGADAVGGVVNIITSGERDGLDLDIAAGGRGLFNGVAAFAQTSGRTSFNLALEHRHDNGFAPNDNDRQDSLLAGYRFAPSRNFSIGLTGRSAKYDLGVPFNTNAFATAYIATPHHRENGTEWQLAVPITAAIGGFETDLRIAQNHRDDHNEDPDAHSFGTTKSDRRNIHLAVRRATAIGTLVVGVEGERAEAENHDSYGLDITTHRRSSNAAFVEDRLSRGPLQLSVGVRVDRYTTFGSETSPRLGVAWTSGGHKLHAAYGEAFRAPQIGELYLPFFGNPDLHAERSRSAEVGYDRFFGNDGHLSVTAFRNSFRDLIVYDLAANHFANIGLARSRGVEIGAGNRLGRFTTALTYTYLLANEQPSGLPLLRRPKHSGSLALGYDLGDVSAECVVARVGSRPDVNDLFPFGTVTSRAYTVADLTVHWNMGMFIPYAKIENLTNTRYQEVFGFPSPTRRALLGIRYTMAR
jgi:vitamin B12 transporter